MSGVRNHIKQHAKKIITLQSGFCLVTRTGSSGYRRTLSYPERTTLGWNDRVTYLYKNGSLVQLIHRMDTVSHRPYSIRCKTSGVEVQKRTSISLTYAHLHSTLVKIILRVVDRYERLVQGSKEHTSIQKIRMKMLSNSY